MMQRYAHICSHLKIGKVQGSIIKLSGRTPHQIPAILNHQILEPAKVKYMKNIHFSHRNRFTSHGVVDAQGQQKWDYPNLDDVMALDDESHIPR